MTLLIARSSRQSRLLICSSKLNVTEKALIVLPENDKKIVNSARNIRGVDATFVGAINTYEVLNHTKCIILKDAVEKLEEVYA